MKKFVFAVITLAATLILAACGGVSNGAGSSVPPESGEEPMKEEKAEKNARLLYMGQGSVRITTPEGKVIYIDPYAGDGYGVAADLILITHAHSDHNNPDMVKNRNPGCSVITWKEALEGGRHNTFDFGFAAVEATEAGYNRNHSVDSCVGYIITLSNGVSVYLSGDTSTTKQMPELAKKHIDYAFFCCDGIYNMDIAEAEKCAVAVGAKHSIPYHVIAQRDRYFDRARADKFNVPGKLIIDENEETELVKEAG